MQPNKSLELALAVQSAVTFSQQVVQQLGDGVGDRVLEIHLRRPAWSVSCSPRYSSETLTRPNTNGADTAPIFKP